VTLLVLFQINNSLNLGKSIDEKGLQPIDKVMEHNSKKNIRQFEKHLKIHLSTFADLTAHTVYNLDKEDLEIQLQNYIKFDAFCSLSIIRNLDKKTIAQAKSKKTKQNCKKHIVPIKYKDQYIGDVEAYYTLDPIKKSLEKNKDFFLLNMENVKQDINNLTLHSILSQILISIIILVVLILFIIKHINKSIVNPVNNLLEKMENIKANSLENISELKCACSQQDDEIGKLYNYFYKHVATLINELNHRANYDGLTGLYSRQKLLNDLENIEHFNLCLIDINKFKEFNNFLGIKAGDEIIKKTASYLLKFFDQFEYKIYRFNGDEFAILDRSKKDIIKFEYDIQNFIEHLSKKEFTIFNEVVTVSLCGGITNCNDTDPIVAATTALKYSKKENLDTVTYSENLPLIKEFKNNFHITKLIRKAIEKDFVVPYFQPIKNIKKDKVDKYEALMRIIDSKGNISYPNDFLDVSQKAGLYKELSLNMIKKSIQHFQNKKELTVTVNLSTKDIQDKKVLKFIHKLKVEKNSMKNIVFEITEQDGIENFEEVEAFINEVKQYGAKIAIDDFGSGYSNFENIIHLGIDYLKIDGSLIKNIATDKNSKIIVETIVQFAKRLEIETVAEFVSDEKIYKIVKDIGVDYAQGYYIGKPSAKLL
jgi:diguanylate cyclase (GGDEF)-like protein